MKKRFGKVKSEPRTEDTLRGAGAPPAHRVKASRVPLQSFDDPMAAAGGVPGGGMPGGMPMKRGGRVPFEESAAHEATESAAEERAEHKRSR